MLIAVMLWFSSFNRVFTSDKTAYVFGRIMPQSAMLFTISQRFFSRLLSDGRRMVEAKAAMSGYEKGIVPRMKNAASILIALINKTLEGAVDTADSMYARGCGTVKRTSFSVFYFTYRDGVLLGLIVFLSCLLLAFKLKGLISFVYFPCIDAHGGMTASIAYLLYALLCFMPVIYDVWEDMEWRRR